MDEHECFECGEVIVDWDGRHEDDDGHPYHPSCCPDCDWEEEDIVDDGYGYDDDHYEDTWR
jgi:hypothetical protein